MLRNNRMQCAGLSLVIVLASAVAAKNISVLWIGNSFLNNSAAGATSTKMLEASTSDVRITKNEYSYMWNSSLRDHYGGGNALAMIRAGGHDYVVLQDFYYLPPVWGESYSRDAMKDYLGRFISEVKKAGGIPVVFSIWGIAKDWTYLDSLTKVYMAVAKSNSAVGAPCGGAWYLTLKQNSSLTLWSADNFHPGPLGGYACAAVFFEIFSGKSPVGNSYTAGIDAATSRLLQEKAHEAIQTYTGTTPAAAPPTRARPCAAVSTAERLVVLNGRCLTADNAPRRTSRRALERPLPVR